MRRRTFTRSLPGALAGIVGVAALAACTSDDPAPAETGTGSAPSTPELPETPIDPAPETVRTLAETVDKSELRLPLEMTTHVMVAPGWSGTPLQLGGMFLGHAEEEDALRYIAVVEDGTISWTARRPLSCTGMAVSRADDDTPVAVLPDVAAGEGQLVISTVTGYDLVTGQTLWGPTEVPGPQVAPGLVYGAPGEQPMGAGGERTAISASTGETVLSEADLDAGRILAEHLGTVLHTEGPLLVGISSVDGSRLWELELPASADPMTARVPGAIDPLSNLVVVRGDTEAGDSFGMLVNLADGSVLVEDAAAAVHDLATETTVVASGTTVTGIDPEGNGLWRHVDPEVLRLVSAGERLSYALRPEEGTLVVLDTLQGLMVQPYDVDVSGPLGVPEVFSAEAAVAVRISDDTVHLVTTELDMDFGS